MIFTHVKGNAWWLKSVRERQLAESVFFKRQTDEPAASTYRHILLLTRPQYFVVITLYLMAFVYCTAPYLLHYNFRRAGIAQSV